MNMLLSHYIFGGEGELILKFQFNKKVFMPVLFQASSRESMTRKGEVLVLKMLIFK